MTSQQVGVKEFVGQVETHANETLSYLDDDLRVELSVNDSEVCTSAPPSWRVVIRVYVGEHSIYLANTYPYVHETEAPAQHNQVSVIAFIVVNLALDAYRQAAVQELRKALTDKDVVVLDPVLLKLAKKEPERSDS